MKKLNLFAIAALALLSLGLSACNRPASQQSTAAKSADVSAAPAPEMQTLTLVVQGMHCSGCPSIISDALEKLPGVESCTASLEDASAQVRFDPALITQERIAEEVVALGYKVGDAAAAATSTDEGGTTAQEGGSSADLDAGLREDQPLAGQG
jgi:copper chaperone